MLRLLNVAIPAKVPVPVRLDLSPESVSPPGLFPMATVTVGRPPGNDVTLFPEASWTVTLTAGEMIVPAVVLVGCTVNASWAAGPAVIVTAFEVTLVSPVAAKLSVRSPTVPLMERFVKVAVPLDVVVAVAVPPKVPPPVAIAAVTVTPLWFTGLPLASRTWITGCWANATPLWALLDGWVVMLSCDAAPAVRVIVPEVAEVSPVAVKLKVRSPAVPVIARFVKLATPLPFVAAVSVPPSVPPPIAIAAVTVTPLWLTGFPLPSRIWITGCWANVTPLWAVPEGWVVRLSWVAAPAMMVIVPDVTPVRPAALKLKVRSPAVPVMVRFVKLATPLPFVAAVRVPPRVPPPVAIAAVSVTPLWLTGLPLASRTWITGCWANATPLWAVLDGSVVSVSWLAAPAVIVTVVEVAFVSPVAVKLKVRSPAVPVIERLVKLAVPPEVVVAVSVPP